MATRKTNSSNKKGSSTSPLDILNASSFAPKSRSTKVGDSGDLRKLSLGSRATAKPLQFGSPAYKGTSTSSKGKDSNSWSGLLGSISSGGISDVLGGGGLLSAGLDYLTSGIASLFGESKSSPEPLTRFVLPDSQDQTIAINNPQAAPAGTPSGLYNSGSSLPLPQPSKASIIQTVKNALLTSSTLNDVIGDL